MDKLEILKVIAFGLYGLFACWFGSLCESLSRDFLNFSLIIGKLEEYKDE